MRAGCLRQVFTFQNAKYDAKLGKRLGLFSAVFFSMGCAKTYANSWFGGGDATNTKKERAIEACERNSDESSIRCLSMEDAKLLKLTLYQYQVCPFCCKLRAFLDFYGIKYNIVEVEPVMRKELKWSDYRKVPILVQEDTKGNLCQMNDSSVIISVLTTFMATEYKDLSEITMFYPKLTSKGNRGREIVEYSNRYEIMLGKPGRSKAEKEEKKWREWVDGVLVHYIPPNIYRTPTEATQAFDYISTVSNYGTVKGFFSKYIGAAGMYLISKKLKKKYNLKPDVRESLYDASREWTAAVGYRTFMGGDQPNLADLSVYGVLSSIEGLDAFNDMLSETPIGLWYYHMKEAVQSHAGRASDV